ncbi:TEF transcription factor, PAR bZIP family member a isoform X2 [Hippoglossus hippoglossus]|uniref:TEF transcription factor, PAR bZIP family member a isoform X2 n=1 Tax=Hippoglossus hippoglossus TaxID=8267 RepID=UPI00148C568F|nr:TEF transcription factor, PAR bZIP family member a isoform X2 [Hippoglossus hippoglossus]XP_035001176.1 TEF transcription factor, PAR bZIP family member a isoform X2 [Hippoglossus stenolepis]
MTAEMPEVFRALLEHPFTLPAFDDNDTNKEKLFLGDNVELGGGGSDMGPSAALTPAIWEKTIPYDGENFHLEYMDLEEFLMENGIPTALDEDPLKTISEGFVLKTKVKAPAQTKVIKPTGVSPVALLPIQELDRCEEEVVIITKDDSEFICDVTAEVTTEEEGATPEPIKPEEIEVDINYEPDPTDLVLSSVPGGELFNPRKHKFTEDELKPQPMIKKAKKVYVPDEQKDDRYWNRRKKNNVAAKRSRDARRLKENQITVRAAFLERENAVLRTEVGELRKDCGRFKNIVGRYEAKFGTIEASDDQ